MRPALPRRRVQSAVRAGPLPERRPAGGEGAVAQPAAHRPHRARHPQRVRPERHAHARRPRLVRRLLRRQVRRQLVPHADRHRQPRAAVPPAVLLGRARPLHRAHRRRLPQLPGRRPGRPRDRRPRQGRAPRQGAHPALHARDRAHLHARVPSHLPPRRWHQEDGRAPARRAVLQHVDAGPASDVRAAAPAADALPPPAVHRAPGDAAARGRRAHRAPAGPHGPAAARGVRRAPLRGALAPVEHAAQQGPLLPPHGGAGAPVRGAPVVRRRLPLEEPGDHRRGAHHLRHARVLPQPHPAHLLRVQVPAGPVELPVPAEAPVARGHQGVARRAGAPGRAGRGVRRVPDGAAARGGAHAARPAAEPRGADPGDGRRRRGARRAGPVRDDVAGPPRHGHVPPVVPVPCGDHLPGAVPGGGAADGVLRDAPPGAPAEAARRADQLLPPTALQGRLPALIGDSP
ncbi:hypothetical protein PVAP13_1KG431505 [Panicum virgatum]|uniref:Uncharacterized protein n=1 Tax=Panicum virgatum TaxID=38727 RepID=A0A8T0XMK9_PANVG|nr:hypothetical protein PVAP13_1KG431505 [Panicum virgatum]